MAHKGLISKMKIAIGMSGGVDSSIAGYLLKKEGHEVVGFTLKLWDDGSRCCDLKDIAYAQRFAYKLGIPHYVIDLREEFKKKVVDYFITEYLNGRTPNPCVVCNKEIKFVQLLNKLNFIEFDYIATGHYTRIVKIDKDIFLSKAKDKKKTQEYFLARLDKDMLRKIIFPLGDLTKEEVKKIAQNIDFEFRRGESQEICFIKQSETYYDFIIKNIDNKKEFTGEIIDKNGKVLGKHNCYFKYTIGQRQGLGLSDRTPYYVIKIDAKQKKVIVGKREDVYRKELIVNNIYWYKNNLPLKMSLKVRIRYNHKEAEAEIEQRADKVHIRFSEPQPAITPGQLAVFYDNELVLGSGWILGDGGLIY